MEQLHQSLNSLKLLRTNVGQIFETLYNGEEHGENKFLQELQELLTSTNTHLRLVIYIFDSFPFFETFINWNKIIFDRDLESTINSLSTPPAPLNLGNTSYLAQELSQDRQALYSQLVNSYKWIDKVRLICKL